MGSNKLIELLEPPTKYQDWKDQFKHVIFALLKEMIFITFATSFTMGTSSPYMDRRTNAIFGGTGMEQIAINPFLPTVPTFAVRETA